MIRRERQIQKGSFASGSIIYWMRREQRVRDNWALLFAQEQAVALGQEMHVLFCINITQERMAERQTDFLLCGLAQVEAELRPLHIPFTILLGDPGEEIPRWCSTRQIAGLVADFSPLRQCRHDLVQVAARLNGLPVFEVDAHNIVPYWVVSAKQEYGAYTLRPKLHRLLPHYLVEFPPLKPQQPQIEPDKPIDWQGVRKQLKTEPSGPSVSGVEPGGRGALRQLEAFLSERLADYGAKHNDPVADIGSGLSSYFHFGHIAPQRVALEVLRQASLGSSSEAFLEQLVVRRELADNYCYYNSSYDGFAGLPAWGQATLMQHRSDRRESLYQLEELEAAATHDAIWNAAQTELVSRGKIHGYLRMYWAKRLLEWTEEPAEALRWTIYLNDRYALDGCDPNGYANIAWCIGGLHDRPWPERPIFGKVRYMNANGLRRKFAIEDYVRKISGLSKLEANRQGEA
ncbi:MAG: deoxyribodipyrimidine photo-lyase [Negativicutes bacterium]|nr:deoxyribodipyrimidine photo-lyase [Negativicutes bacterium]